jgi:hypothetical protein
MSDNPQIFVQTTIGPVLQQLGLDEYRLQAAEELLLGTALQESGLIYRRQLHNGPALGLFQMEPATHDDIWVNFLTYHPAIAKILRGLAPGAPAAGLLETEDAYAAAMCRVHYWRMGQIVGQKPLPAAGDLAGMATYWKRFYNTPAGGGNEAEFIASWKAHNPSI